MNVMKFGGTSVANAERIKQVGQIVKQEKQKHDQLVVVCSALGGVTDALIELSELAAHGEESYLVKFDELSNRHLTCAGELLTYAQLEQARKHLQQELHALEEILRGIFLIRECTMRSKDLVMSFGERLSNFLVCEHFKSFEPQSVMLDTRYVVKTDERFGNARIKMEETFDKIRNHSNGYAPIRVVTGFLGSTDHGETTTFGRGGSDYTASLFGAALGADEIQIWTDVSGVLSADPRIVKDARAISQMTYEEAMEMSHFGAKVIYPPTMQPARELGIPIVIKNTFEPSHEGTRISSEQTANGPMKGISSIKEVALIRVSGSGMVGVTGTAGRMFSALARSEVNIMMITQGSSEHSICVVVSPEDVDRSLKAIKEEFALQILQRQIDHVSVERGLSVIAVIGEQMRQVTGIAGKIFQALGDHGVNVIAIAQGSSERNISIVVKEDHVARGIRAIHDRFFTATRPPLQMVLVGTGLVGGTLLKQLASRSNQDPEITLCGVTNSKKMLLDTDGVDPGALDARGAQTNIGQLVEWMKQSQFPNVVFVDCTASDEPVRFYEELLRSGAHVVTPNKRATSGGFDSYKALKAACRGNRFCYETNVGAGLPVISVLRSLIDSGDRIHKIEGTLSGTLSYLFNTFDQGMSFTDLLQGAREKGFTEPDPRDDLSGMDVARKLLILAREIGLELELEDVEVENLVPTDCRMQPDVDGFFSALRMHDQRFGERVREARKQGKALRYVARVEDGRASVKLEMVGSEHPCYGLSGSDNLISFTTDRYRERPLVVRGPGAGAEVTAAGVLADIISCSR